MEERFHKCLGLTEEDLHLKRGTTNSYQEHSVQYADVHVIPSPHACCVKKEIEEDSTGLSLGWEGYS